MKQNKRKNQLLIVVRMMNLKNPKALRTRQSRGTEETDADAGDIDEDAIVDENQEMMTNQSWLNLL